METHMTRYHFPPSMRNKDSKPPKGGFFMGDQK